MITPTQEVSLAANGIEDFWVAMLVDVGLSWSPGPYALMKGPLLGSLILSWPMSIPSPFSLQVILLSHFKLAHVHSKPMLTSS